MTSHGIDIAQRTIIINCSMETTTIKDIKNPRKDHASSCLTSVKGGACLLAGESKFD